MNPSETAASDLLFMHMALREALSAADGGEVPVGAVIVRAGTVLGKAHNQVELLRDPTAHAEILAITQASEATGDWRLTATTLYVTKEPCPMCAGALALARIPRLVYGIADPQRGGAASVFPILNHPGMLHRTEIVAGVLSDECRDVIQTFFRTRRRAPQRAYRASSVDTGQA